jgi:O-Antigen ligase
VVVAGTLAAATAVRSGAVAAIADRVVSLDSPTTGSALARLDLWRDSAAVIAARPLTGWGPDTLGLVFPQHQSGELANGFAVDETHSEVLQVAVTQGMVGVVCYLWILAALLIAYLRGRSHEGATAMFAGILAYQLALQFNFSWVPAAAPFWLFAAVAVVTWDPRPPAPTPSRRRRPVVVRAAAATAAGIAAMLCVAALVVAPLVADASFFSALAAMHAGDLGTASSAIAEARLLAPQESAYAKTAGDIALHVDISDTPGPGADPAAAAQDYSEAIDLGTLQVGAYRRLAVADLLLGRVPAALEAVRQAVAVDPYDSLSTTLEQRILALLSNPG